MHTIPRKYYYIIFTGRCISLGKIRHFNTTFITQTSIQIKCFDDSNNYLPTPDSHEIIFIIYTQFNTIIY